MGIRAERDIARADMNDEFGVTVWQERKQCDYTVAEARALAAEIVAAADEAERILMDEVHESTLAPIVARNGEVVL